MNEKKLFHDRYFLERFVAILALIVVGIIVAHFLFSGKELASPVSASIALDTIEANKLVPVVSEGNAEERGDLIFRLALELQENITLPSQKKAIKAFEEAKATYIIEAEKNSTKAERSGYLTVKCSLQKRTSKYHPSPYQGIGHFKSYIMCQYG